MKSLLLKDKRGLTLGDIYPAVLTLVLIGVVLGIGIYVLSEIDDQIAAGEASDAINETMVAIGGFSGWIAIIVIVIAAAVVLGIILSSFGRTRPGV